MELERHHNISRNGLGVNLRSSVDDVDDKKVDAPCIGRRIAVEAPTQPDVSRFAIIELQKTLVIV